MSWLIDQLMRSAIGQGALALLGGIVAVMLWLRRRDARRDRSRRMADDLSRAQANVATRRRMDYADIGVGDPDDDAEWLLARGQRPRREPTLVRRH